MAPVYPLGMSEHTQALLDWFMGSPLRIISVLIGALIIRGIGNRAIHRTVARISSADLKPGPGVIARQAERAKTIGTVLSSTFNGIVWLIAFTMIVGEFGFNLGPVIASAGVIGVAVGLGSQTLVKDFISGIFMLIEDQYGVGDEVKVGEVSGTVETVGLRVTTIRDPKGTLWYLRNGEILVVGNDSKK
jgi:small-conductance mechanosensitive channel